MSVIANVSISKTVENSDKAKAFFAQVDLCLVSAESIFNVMNTGSGKMSLSLVISEIVPTSARPT